MKEIVLIGFGGNVFDATLTELLESGLSIVAFVPNPDRFMVNNPKLVIHRLDLNDKTTMIQSFTGYDKAIIALETNLTNHDLNEIVLKHYNTITTAVIEAGVKRLIVVGGPYSEAFYTGDLKRHEGYDWKFISTEGNYPRHIFENL
ncbi:MAG: NAD(P)H-binding protein [Muribaculaceae bacterium]|nr:NAD(P)H-binding protein [Muribaculaceae bacterium]